MRYRPSDLPRKLYVFECDTGDAVHGYAGITKTKAELRERLRHYMGVPSVQRVIIGTYVLDSTEIKPTHKGAA